MEMFLMIVGIWQENSDKIKKDVKNKLEEKRVEIA